MSSLLAPHLLDRLSGLDVIARRVVEGAVAGRHRSLALGAGEEFARHRAYQQGDDVRRIDWRLHARTDRYYVREYREDSNLRAYLVVDASLSMGYADSQGVTKLRYASILAAALAFLMIRSGDQVGLASYGAGVTLHAPPSARQGHLAMLFHVLDRLEATGTGAAAEALERVGSAMPRRGRVILVSDLLEDDDGDSLLAALGQLRARGDEVVVFRPLTPAETGEAAPGAGRYFDPERPDRALPAVPAEDAGYRSRVAAYFDGLAAGVRERGVEYVPLLTTTPPEHALERWLLARRG